MSDLKNAASRILDPQTSMLVIIDPQTKLMPAIFEADRVTRNCVLLLRLGQILSIPTVVTTQYSEGLGPLVSEITCALSGTATLDKTSFGCFEDEHFRAHLKEFRPAGTRCWWQALSRTSVSLELFWEL